MHELGATLRLHHVWLKAGGEMATLAGQMRLVSSDHGRVLPLYVPASVVYEFFELKGALSGITA
jgi:hypothetical protein